MPPLTAVPAAFALLLGAAGVSKLTRPAATESALHTTWLPADARAVRAFGAGELLLAAAVLVVPGTASMLALAAAYLLFAVFAEAQRRRGAACGCFGQTTPATRLHVAVNVTAAATAVAAAVTATPPLSALVRADVPAGVTALVLAAVCAGLLRALLTDVPELSAAVALHAGGDA